jgi:hypothetical protein
MGSPIRGHTRLGKQADVWQDTLALMVLQILDTLAPLT